MLSRPWPRVVSSSGSRRRGAWLCLACWFRFSAGGVVFVGLRRIQVRRNGHSWLFSGFRISAELQVAVKAMTTTDCLACGGMCSLRNDGCRLPGFTPGCCSGKTFLPFCVSASRCQVVIPRLTRYPGLQVLMSDCVGLHIRRNGLLRVKLKRARRVASGLAVMPAGTPVGFYFRCVGWLSAFMRIPDSRCLIRFKSYVHLFLRLRAVCLCLVGLQVRRNGHSWSFSGFRFSAE